VTSLALPRLEDLPSPAGQRVLLRTDFNVPSSSGRITDDLRIRASIDTLTWLLGSGARQVTVATPRSSDHHGTCRQRQAAPWPAR
jgi:phosphoglycerate kinase